MRIVCVNKTDFNSLCRSGLRRHSYNKCMEPIPHLRTNADIECVRFAADPGLSMDGKIELANDPGKFQQKSSNPADFMLLIVEVAVGKTLVISDDTPASEIRSFKGDIAQKTYDSAFKRVFVRHRKEIVYDTFVMDDDQYMIRHAIQFAATLKIDGNMTSMVPAVKIPTTLQGLSASAMWVNMAQKLEEKYAPGKYRKGVGPWCIALLVNRFEFEARIA